MPKARFCGNCGEPIPENADQAGVPGAHARAGRRSVLLWPAVVILAVLLAGGGFTAAMALIRYFDGQHETDNNLSADSPATASPASSRPPATSAQVSMPGATVGIGTVDADPAATAAATTLAAYFGGINTRNYTQAWDAYTAVLRAAIGFQSFATAVSTSRDSQVVVQSIRHDAGGNIEADVSFRSHQAGKYGPSNGQTCTNWSLDYHLVPAGAAAGPDSLSYLIDQVTEIGAGHTSC